jgi:transposase
MLSIGPAYRYYLYIHPTDMRKNFDGLSGIVQTEFPHHPIHGDVFIFISRRRNQIKLLHWQGDGFAIWYKRLERGTYERPVLEHNNTLVKLSSKQLVLILEGISLLSVKERPRYQLPINS